MKKKYGKYGKSHKFFAVISISLLLLAALFLLWKYATSEIFLNETITDFDNITNDILNNAPYEIINNNVPFFTDEEKAITYALESYSELDELGRCGAAYANVCRELMPTDERGDIGMIKPSGWHTVRYDDLIDDKYLYNRCHLIAYALTGENANDKNLITGTRFLNIEGMLPFEIAVANYVRDTNNHVLYRVTPNFIDDELVARSVTIEAWSVEDKGKGICFNVLCPNIQPGIEIDYKTGESRVGE